jgi:hypothetical protein
MARTGGQPAAMGDRQDLWGALTALERQMPLSPETVTSVLGAQLEPVRQAQMNRWSFYRASGSALRDGVVVSNVDLRVSIESPHQALLVLDISGRCVSVSEIASRFKPIEITDAPRGHSVDEETVWSTTRAWGNLAFGFKERQPDCLATIAFDERARR